MNIRIKNYTNLNYYEILELLYFAEDNSNVIFNHQEYQIISKHKLFSIDIIVKKV